MQPFETLTKRGQVARLRQLALNALTAFGIRSVRLELLQHGDNTTFRVSAEYTECYVLRIHRSGQTILRQRSPAEIRSEMMYLAFLIQEEGFVVPSPVKTLDGDFLATAEAEGVPEPRICVLFRWVEGRFIDSRLTSKHLERVGSFMANLHNSGTRFHPPEKFARGRLDNLCGKPLSISEAVARSQVDNPEDEATAIKLVTEMCSPEDGARVKRLIEIIRKVQLELGHSPETFGLIHGDLHQENYFFHQGQVRAIDFDDCGYGHYLYDIAVTLFNIDDHENKSVLKKGLLEGYHSVRPLPKEHEAYLGVFMTLRELQMMLWVIEMRDHPEFRETWQEDVKASCKYIQKVVEEK
jgi:Ser/Thr protein kinase RdoA (MazF antagonist)